MRSAVAAATLISACLPLLASAQATCSSDGQPRPVAVLERFISADCEACWGESNTPAPSAESAALVLDWIVPTAAGDDAPLSAAATNDALARLQALGRSVPTRSDVHIATTEAPAPGRLRVAHGLPFNDYLGAAISLTPPRGGSQRGAAEGPWTFNLLMVESIPAGAEGTAVARNVVRNLLQGTWDGRNQLSKKERSGWKEIRPMRIPEGSKPERLRMVGWVQDAQGRMVAAAQSDCR